MKRKMSRSTFLLGVGGAATLASLRLQASEAAQMGRRNVLWIVDDDHPQSMMSPLPATRRKIRDVGTNFRSGSTDIPLCGPARVSLLTGLERVMNSIRNALGMRETEMARELRRPWNSHFYAVFAQVHNTL